MAKRRRESKESEVGSEGSSSGVVSSPGSREKKSGESEEGLWSEKKMEREEKRREREEKRREKRKREQSRKLHLWEEI